MKKIIISIFIIFGFFVNKSYSQRSDSTLTIGELAFNLIPDTANQVELTNAIKGFLKAKNRGLVDNSYVKEEYLKESIQPFIWLRDAEGKLPNGSNFYTPTLLTVLPNQSNKYIIKLAYLGVFPPTKLPEIKLIASLEIRKINNKYYFYDAVEYNTRFWNVKKVGNIKYIYSNKLDMAKAKEMDKFNTSFAEKFNTEPLQIIYYKCDDPEQMFKMLGFDYIENMYYSLSGGLAYPWVNTLVAGNNSELYEHEAVHFYISALFNNVNRSISEGYATYIGGSGGVKISRLAVFAKEYLNKNPNADISALATDFNIRVNGGTPLFYILNALVCKDVDEKIGIEGIKRLHSPEPGDDYFATLKRVNGIGKEEFPAYIKGLLAKY